MNSRSGQPKSVLGYVLSALIPYSSANLKLAFKPGQFFAQLEKISRANRNTLASTLSRAKRLGLVTVEKGRPVLTADGWRKIGPPEGQRLSAGQRLMVIFDVPETRKNDRQRLREFLGLLGFEQLQKSVWVCEINHEATVKEAVSDLNLESCVQLLIASQI